MSERSRTTQRGLLFRWLLGIAVGLIILVLVFEIPGSDSKSPTFSGIAPINDFTMYSTQAGWGVGANNIWRVTDGGRSWTNVTPPRTAFHIIGGTTLNTVWDFTSADRAWVIAASSAPNTFQISKTVNAGRSWRQFHIALPNASQTPLPPPFQVDFVNPRQGWLSLSSGAAGPQLHIDLYATNNGGRTWRLVYDTETGGWVNFTTPNLGWLLPGQTTMQIPRVTTNGGRSWQRIVLHSSGTSSAQHAQKVLALATPTFDLHESHGLMPILFAAAGQSERVGVAVISANGMQWGPVTMTINASAVKPLLAQTISTQLAWFVTSGRLWRSTDAGHSFVTRSSAGFLAHVTGMEFVNRETGWLWTSSTSNNHSMSRIWMTKSGGRHWSSWIPSTSTT